ncbi:DUF2024 family protein [Kordia zhangzhouensis]|uniref:DUF2024 family protein n=1 Tax=Kordia zhangzhouensis TaxID=1620405 RepID=UPI0006293285|nr:DUF2024 family protein [Kordia zhangzhouensis]
MKVAVWDTYVQREDGKIMHFDILVPSETTNQYTVFEFGKHYVKSKPFRSNQLSTKECKFCHIEQATEEVIASIKKVGFHIIEMENCN